MMLKLVPNKKNTPLIPITSNILKTILTEKEFLDLKKKLVPNNEIIISFWGIRNIHTSINAIVELKKEGYKIKVLLIGKISKDIPSNLPKDTIKTGILCNGDIDKYFIISDVFILPKGKSGCSLKMVLYLLV